MKNNILKTFFLFFSFLLFGQKKDSNCNYSDSIFKLLPNEMTFDIEKYKVETMSGYDKVLIDNENYRSYFFQAIDRIAYNQTNKNMNVDKTIYYYFNGKIERIIFYYQPYKESGSPEIGTSITYNSDGNVIETYNYDKGYKICYDEVLPLARKIIGERKIKKYELQFSLGRVDLNKFPNSNPEWYVVVTGNDNYRDKIAPAHSYCYVIDGITGKLRQIQKISVIHEYLTN
jgi:hypothetical protein